jgi:peptidoglycan/xylan/chitin deacetylase (PgdA/CDA1 family)
VTFDDGDRGNRDVLLPVIEELELPVAIFVATGQVQEQRPYWFDRLLNALQTDVPVKVTVPAPWITSVINETRGNRNWRRIDQLLSSLKKLRPKLRELVVDDIVRKLPRQNQRSRGIAPLTISDIKELATCPAVTIGAHSHCHSILTQLDERAVFQSALRSKELLESWTGLPVNYFAYPNGDFNEAVISAVKAAGFEAALTTVREPWNKGQQLYTLPRVGVGRYDSFDAFKVMLTRGYRHFLK